MKSTALLAACCAAVSSAAGAPDEPVQPGNLNPITVVAPRDRAMVQKQADHFVSHVLAAPFDESLARWRTPVCPLVAGVPRDDGEYLLEKLSAIARTAGVPLAGEHCRPNFWVVLSPEPDLLLKAWSRRDVNLFGDGGGARLKR